MSLSKVVWNTPENITKGRLMENCVFCQKQGREVLFENELAEAFYDHFPVNEGHLLVIPKRHVQTYFDASAEELSAINELVFRARKFLSDRFSPDGYNIGFNVGEAAGQTVFHLHCHVIPRYLGDVENPRGGIRKVRKSMVPYPGCANGSIESGK